MRSLHGLVATVVLGHRHCIAVGKRLGVVFGAAHERVYMTTARGARWRWWPSRVVLKSWSRKSRWGRDLGVSRSAVMANVYTANGSSNDVTVDTSSLRVVMKIPVGEWS